LWAKKYPCALEEFHKIVKQNPDSAAAHMLNGEALDGLGRTPEAIAEFEVAAKVAPREPNLNFGLGYLHWKVRQYDDAERYFDRELAIDPGNAQALTYLGDVEMKRNNPERALVLLKKAVQLRDDIRIAHVDLGSILAQRGQNQEAIAALQRAVKLDPAQPDAHFRLGRVYQAMGNSAAAQKEFATVRELHQKAEEDLTSKMSPSPSSPHP
jgi:tetratricopeptide (TPR) repeat protein